MTNGTTKTTLGQNENWQTGQTKHEPKSRIMGEGCGPAFGWAPKGGSPNLERVGSPNPERWGPEGWGPQGGAPKGGAPKGGAQGWGTEGWGPEGWGAQNFALFFSLPARIFFLSSLSWGSFRGILLVFLKRRSPEMCTFGVLGLSCASPGGPVWTPNTTKTTAQQHTTRHNTQHPTTQHPTTQHTNHANHTTTHTPHTDVVFFVPSSVFFYFVPMSFFCPACLFFLSRLRFFVPTTGCSFCPVFVFLSRCFFCPATALPGIANITPCVES